MGFLMPLRSRAPYGSLRALLLLLLVARCLFAPSIARAQDTSFSGSLSNSLGDPLTSESGTSGLSSSLLPEGSSLLTPSLRSGISDPLGFLIETGSMSPFSFSYSDSYAQVEAQSQTLNDPVLALRFNEYRNNRALMAGAATTSTSGARTTGAGVMGGQASRRRVEGAGSTSSAAALAPFSAGSSALSARAGMQSGFVDPNALLAASGNSAGSLNGILGSAPGEGSGDASALVSSQPVGFSSADADIASASGVIPSGYTAASTSAAAVPEINSGVLQDTGADAMPIGVAPGRTQPLVTMSTSATNGFPDSTMGTAGGSMPEPYSGLSPLLWGAANADAAGSGGQSLSFLHPSLRSRANLAPQGRGAVSVDELARRMRLQAMLKNPNVTMPSSFERGAMVRDYRKNQENVRRGRRPSHYAQGIGTTAAQQERH